MVSDAEFDGLTRDQKNKHLTTLLLALARKQVHDELVAKLREELSADEFMWLQWKTTLLSPEFAEEVECALEIANSTTQSEDPNSDPECSE